MTRVSLRTKFLAVLLLGVLAVTAATLLVVRRTVDKQIRAELSADLRNSVVTFNIFQTEREMALGRSAELLASLPTVKALMTTEDVQTIQDASNEIWRIGGKNLLVLASPSGRIMAVHATAAPQAASRNTTGAAAREGCRRPLARPPLPFSLAQALALSGTAVGPHSALITMGTKMPPVIPSVVMTAVPCALPLLLLLLPRDARRDSGNRRSTFTTGRSMRRVRS